MGGLHRGFLEYFAMLDRHGTIDVARRQVVRRLQTSSNRFGSGNEAQNFSLEPEAGTSSSNEAPTSVASFAKRLQQAIHFINVGARRHIDRIVSPRPTVQIDRSALAGTPSFFEPFPIGFELWIVWLDKKHIDGMA